MWQWSISEDPIEEVRQLLAQLNRPVILFEEKISSMQRIRLSNREEFLKRSVFFWRCHVRQSEERENIARLRDRLAFDRFHVGLE